MKGKRVLSVALSFAMIISIFCAVPSFVKAADDGVAPSEYKFDTANEIEKFDNYEKGAGYIAVTSPGDDGMYVEIVNLFHSEAVTPYNGINYNLATNTLTLDNVAGSNWTIQCDQMLHLKIQVNGACTIGSFGFWETYPSFTGTGTLTINGGIEEAVNYDIAAAGIAPVSVDNNVTLNLKGTAEKPAADISIASKSNTYDTSKLIKYEGKVSETLKWENKEVFGGPSQDWIRLSGVRARTVFKATKILKKKEYTGSNNYYIASISHVGNDPMDYHHISQLVEKDGYWFEKDDGNNYWNKDSLFENYTSAEVASLPSTLVNSEGYATAYLSTQFDYGQSYVKDNKVYILNADGRFRNLIVDPVEPNESALGNDITPKVVMKVVKYIPSEDVNLVVFGEEYEISEASNYDKAAEFLKTKGYDKFTALVNHPYNLKYVLTISSVTFSPAPVVTTPAPVDINKCTIDYEKSVSYNGKKVEPSVTVTYGTKTLVENTDYTVLYLNNYNVGIARITIKGKGSYTGSYEGTFDVVPKGVKFKYFKSTARGKIKLKWNKQTKQTDGYQIQYCRKKDFKDAVTLTIKKNTTVSKTISGLKSKKTYFVRIRTYKKKGGKKYYSIWSTKKVKVK